MDKKFNKKNTTVKKAKKSITEKRDKMQSHKNKTQKCANVFRFHSFEEEYEKQQELKLKEHRKEKAKDKIKNKSKKQRWYGKNRLKEVMPGNDVEKELIELFKKPFSPSKVTPRSDYYTYINYIWLTNTSKKSIVASKEQKYYVQIDDFRVTQDKVYRQLIEIIENYIKTHNDAKAKLISNVYTSLLRLDETSTKKHIKHSVERYNHSIKNDDLWQYMAHINHNEIVCWGCPIRWKVMVDEKNAKIFRNFISLPELSLYDAELYLDDTYGRTKEFIKYRKDVQKKYIAYVNDIFVGCLGKNHGLSGKDVFDVERDIFIAMGCDSIKKDSPDFYNVVKTKEAFEKYGFNWSKFSEHLGYKKVPEFFICDSLNYLKCICALLKENWKTKKWKSFWLYIYFRQIIRFDKKLVYIHYNFNGKYIHGIPGHFPWDLYPIFGMSLTFNTFLTNEYVKKYKDDEVINYVTSMGKDLITVFKRIIKRNTWLTEKTKQYALLKLEHMNFGVALPKNMREDPLLDYKDNDAWGNLMKITNWRTYKYISLEGEDVEDVPLISWNAFKLIGQQAYIVNAMYTPTQNSIYLPLGYLQKPFVDLDERGIEYNLAHIGFTLAHEMSHSLDDMGSKYDYQGNLHDWWTPEDKRKFKVIQEDIIKQYEKFALYDKIKFDATPSIGEDLADISGLAICQEYLRDFQNMHEDIVPIRSLSFQAFYAYFAMQQRQHIYKQAIAAQLKTNPHPPDKYRVNVPMSRLELFRSLYNIQKGDHMYWPSTSTVW
jgi:putative endopeptidase